MKEKLKRFKEFASEILPHEADYLCSIEQFEDQQKLAILQRIQYNCHHNNQPRPFDATIDKRKYSHLKSWIERKLNEADVDKHFEWINEMDRRVMTDSIRPEDERQLLAAIGQATTADYYFMKFYDLALNFRQYMLIRLRYNEHTIIDRFVTTHRQAYEHSCAVSEKMHRASVDIINQYAQNSNESKQWQAWLQGVFDEPALDGLNRYFAAVRLTFMYFNYREYEKIKPLYDRLDQLLRQGVFYSRRILLNYYANCVLLHSKFDILQQAEEYGYLSIKQKNDDHLKYLNNYSAILLRQGKVDQALQLMRQSLPEMRNTNNLHNKIGFAAFYMKCLCLNGQPADARRFGDSFMHLYGHEVLSQRWHVFFATYLQDMVQQEDFAGVLRTINRYRLLQKDKTFQGSVIYLPTIVWYNALAQYMESKTSKEKVVETLLENSTQYITNTHKATLLNQLIDELTPVIPSICKEIKSQLQQKPIAY